MPVPITLTSPLPPSDLLFESMTLSAGLSMIGEIQLGLVSVKPDLKAEDLLGKPMTVTVQLGDDARRHFHGYVTRFGLGLRRGSYFGYQASVRPWLWFLTRTADCRIFQDLSVPDIVRQVFDDHGSASFEFRLFRSYRKWVYCVQYRETDYNFIARLLEHEGIYWYIEHGDGTSKVVLVDSQSAHDAAPRCQSLPYYEDAADAPPDLQCVSGWSFASEVETDKIESASYNFERPSTSLKVSANKAPKYQFPSLEMFDYQGDYVQSSDGSQWAEDRLDEHQTRHQIAHGASNAHGIEVGRLLKLARHPRDDQNDQYLVTGVSLHASVDACESGGDASAGSFRCDFSAIPLAQQFRPPRRTPKPFVQGPQTAIVVGPAGEEIFTDKYGRVKVQFYWDRRGKKDGNSSCWVRVSSPWAGKNFGGISIPRIGQEVVVDFLEGDPDQPLITGRVYNAEQMPPWSLPANATQSGVLTRSSKGGGYGNANAIRFEDKKGAEQLWIHAEKDQSIEVEADESHSVGHDRSKTVGHDETTHVSHDRTETVGSHEKITIAVNRTEKVGGNEKIGIDGNRTVNVVKTEKLDVGIDQNEVIGSARSLRVGSSDTVHVGSTQSVTVVLAKTEQIGALYQLSVGAAMNQTIIGALVQEVGAAKMVNVAGISTEKIGLSKSIGASLNVNIEAGAKMAQKAKAAYSAEAGSTMSFKSASDYSVASKTKVALEAADELVLKCGSAELVLKSSGDISINGQAVSVNGKGKIVIEAKSALDLVGSDVNINS